MDKGRVRVKGRRSGRITDSVDNDVEGADPLDGDMVGRGKCDSVKAGCRRGGFLDCLSNVTDPQHPM